METRRVEWRPAQVAGAVMRIEQRRERATAFSYLHLGMKAEQGPARRLVVEGGVAMVLEGHASRAPTVAPWLKGHCVLTPRIRLDGAVGAPKFGQVPAARQRGSFRMAADLELSSRTSLRLAYSHVPSGCPRRQSARRGPHPSP